MKRAPFIEMMSVFVPLVRRSSALLISSIVTLFSPKESLGSAGNCNGSYILDENIEELLAVCHEGKMSSVYQH